MSIGTTCSSRIRGGAGMVLAGLAVLAAACASRGGAPTPLTGAEAEAFFAGLNGVWELDESSFTGPFKFQLQKDQTEVLQFETLEEARQVSERIAQESIQRTIAALKPIMEVWLQEPNTLILRVDEERMIYVPTPGRSMEIPMSGEWIIWQDAEGQSVRARVSWDGDRLALERRVGSHGQVRSVLEIVDGRLRISRALRVPRMSTPTPRFILMYDRDEGGE